MGLYNVIKFDGTPNKQWIMYNLYDFNDINGWFRGIINTKISIILGEYIIKNKVSFLDISLYLNEASQTAKEQLDGEFAKYELEMLKFCLL